MASWSICSTVKEPRPVLERFVSHHLSVGADYVHLFFDDPADPSFSHFHRQAGVVAQLCDETYWAQLGRRRPPFQERRQKLNGAFAYMRCQTDWQAHIDADELLLIASDLSISKELACVPDTIETAKAEPIEPLHESRRDPTRTPFKKSGRGLRHRRLARMFGPYLPLLNHAMIGHSHGKSFLRGGLTGWSHGIHRPRPAEGCSRSAMWLEGTKLAHLHCLDREDWLRRVIKKSKDPTYSSGGPLSLLGQLRALLGEAAATQSDVRILDRFFEHVNGYSGRLKDQLDDNEMVLRFDIDLTKPAPVTA